MTGHRTNMCLELALVCVYVSAVSVLVQPASAESDPAVVGEILSAWQRRRSACTSGVTEWEVTQQTRSNTFGAASSGGTVRVLFDSRGFVLESRCSTAEGVVGVRDSFIRDPFGRENSRLRFDAALLSRFRVLKNDVPKGPQPYRLVRSEGRDIHIWEAEADRPPCAGIFPLGEGPDFIAVPTCALLLDALTQSHHLGLNAQEENGSPSLLISPERPLVCGTRCVVIEVQQPFTSSGRSPHTAATRCWLDPTRDYCVLRILEHTADGVLKRRYDFEYDAAEERSTVPSQIHLTQLDGPQIVHDSLSLMRVAMGLGAPLSEDAFTWQFAPGTLVTDFINREQYIISSENRRDYLTVGSSSIDKSKLDTSQHMSITGLPTEARNGNPISFFRSFVARSFSWPWNLATVTVLYMLLQVLRPRVSHRRRNTNCPGESAKGNHLAASER